MKLNCLHEEVRGYEPNPHLRLLIDAVYSKLSGHGDPMIVVRDGGDEAMVTMKGDRRSITIRVSFDYDDTGKRNLPVYRVESGAGIHGKIQSSPDAMEVVRYAVEHFVKIRLGGHLYEPPNPGGNPQGYQTAEEVGLKDKT